MSNLIVTSPAITPDGLPPLLEESSDSRAGRTSTWLDLTLKSRAVSYPAAERPIFAIDPLSFKSDKRTSIISFIVHSVLIAGALLLMTKVETRMTMLPNTAVTQVDFK